jgi:transposase
LRLPGRPRQAAAPVIVAANPPRITRGRRRRGRPRAVDAASKRIAELERKVGDQALEIDFFRRALRHVKAPPRASDGRGAAASSRSSTR